MNQQKYKQKMTSFITQIKTLVSSGNKKRLVVKKNDHHTYVNLPITVMGIGVVFAPFLIAASILFALLLRCDIIIEEVEDKK